jgi:PRTRC genetic system protein B
MLHADPRLGSERFVWWDPPGKRELFFLEGLGLDDTVYNMPGTVFLVTGKTLTVYAFKGARPSGKTPLLRGPFFNYYEDCRICVGSAKVDWPRDITWQTIIDHWEKVFWNSVNAHMISNPMKEGHNLVLSLKEAVNKPYDTGALRPAGLTLASII